MDKIVCVGKNYPEHAKELGDAVPEKPVIFLKPPSVLRRASTNGEKLVLRLPPDGGAVHHECEIVLCLGTGGYRLGLEAARRSIAEVSLGLDMTLRERQAILKKERHPWTVSKVFPDAAVTGPLLSVGDFREFEKTEFRFEIDGKVRQRGVATQMLLRPAECVAYLSEFFELSPGDLIFTGTPAGVGPVTRGQEGRLNWGPLSYSVQWK